MLIPHLVIRPLLELEYPILTEMLYQAVYTPKGAKPFPRNIINDPSIHLYIHNFGARLDDYCLAAELNRVIVGAVWIRLLNGMPKGYGNIDNITPEFAIALLPQYRGKGIGRQLMQCMIHHMKARGYEQASLSVQHDNYAVSLYTKLGFEIIEKRNEDYLMVLKLK